MGDVISQLEAIGTAGLVGLGAVLVVQLVLAVAALVNLARTPAERLRAPKWVWVLVIVFGELVGPIVYFAVARKPEPVDLTPAYRSDETPRPAAEVADLLYGDSHVEDAPDGSSQ